MFPHPRLVTVAIRREILSVLAASRDMTVPCATAHVAANWTARRRQQGESPSAVQATQAIVCQVGADILDELAAERGTAVPPHPEGHMSDYVTWEVCTDCGLLAAVGWAIARGIGGTPDRVWPIEFDCPTGCGIDTDDLLVAYSLSSRTTGGR